ncbi:MAG: molecular chaperone TorD family protein [Candidatus Dormibacteraceae bacterium]
MIDLLRALAELARPPSRLTPRLAAALELPAPPTASDHHQLFGLQLYPYASVQVGPEGMLGGEARDLVAGFGRAVGLAPGAEPDHISSLLEGYAALVERASNPAPTRIQERWQHARGVLLWEHLLSWMPIYLDRVEALGPPAYVSWAGSLKEVLSAEAETCGPPPVLPLCLRSAPALDLKGGVQEERNWRALLIPSRSGAIICRQDLARAARELGLGLRRGERAFILEALLAQDRTGLRHWLGTEFEVRATSYRSAGALAPILAHWRGRAQETARQLQAGYDSLEPPGELPGEPATSGRDPLGARQRR